MLEIDPAKKLSFNRLISNADLVIVYERHDNMKAVTVSENFAPTPELWTLVLSHRTQILYIADISFAIMYLEDVPGCLVLESGTGSGSLTTSLARAVAPTGHVHTFDFHEQRAGSARDDFERTGLSSLISVRVRDIQGGGFPNEFAGLADAVFLDLPQPWLAIPSAEKMLK
ncbi:tRNA (adenine(58)-N(1))-methyltransferase catalytic subunit TRMT61A [Arachis hypogaea]|nr:tRNA (adenine(58)-N(1))-methyltransferase catalytic subunit TRMT61A [Arachis hypogaea]